MDSIITISKTAQQQKTKPHKCIVKKKEKKKKEIQSISLATDLWTVFIIYAPTRGI